MKKSTSGTKKAANSKTLKKSANALPTADSATSIPVVLSGMGGGAYVAGKPFVIERLLTPDEVADEYTVRQAELDQKFEACEKAALKLWKKLSSRDDRENFTGVSARFRTKMGCAVSPLEVVICVNLARKLTLETLEQQGVVPVDRQFQGFRIKVVEGQFDYLAKQSATQLAGSTPVGGLPFSAALTGGVPIAKTGQINDFGTLGVLAVLTTSTIGLTAGHVSGAGTVDQISNTGSTRNIGDVQAISAPPNHTKGGIESLDAAYFEVKGYNGNPGPLVPPAGLWARGLSHPTNQAPTAGNYVPIYFLNRRVKRSDGNLKLIKFGNGSGSVTSGRIKDVNIGVVFVRGFAYVQNFTVEPSNQNGIFAAPGDSGSLLAVEHTIGGRKVLVGVGILFAALVNSPSIGLACNIHEVITRFGLAGTLAPYMVNIP